MGQIKEAEPLTSSAAFEFRKLRCVQSVSVLIGVEIFTRVRIDVHKRGVRALRYCHLTLCNFCRVATIRGALA